MDDLNQIVSQIMSDPNAMTQLRSVAASLGLGGDSGGQEQPVQNPQPAAQNTGGVDLSALSSLLGGLGQPAQPKQPATPDLSSLAGILSGLGAQQAAPPPAANNMPDLSALASLLGLNQNQPPVQPQNAAPDMSSLAGLLGGLTGGGNQAQSNNLSALTALLNNGSPPAQASSGLLPNFDMNTILKLSSALASVQSNRQNIDLLLALKPRLKDERARKVDDAIRVMQLIQFLPLIKESGLFGEMDKILGGLGNIVGGSGLGGLGNLLGGLGGRR